MKAIIKTVSEMTGFSQSTVSNALRGKGRVSPETAEKIRQSARSLGYYEDREPERKVKFVIFRKNGLIVDTTPYFQLLISGAEKECRELGLEMSILNLDKRDPHYEEQIQWLKRDVSSGIILLGNEMEDDDFSLIEGIKAPLVVIDSKREGRSFNSVMGTNQEAVMLATEYLIARGHTQIGYLRGEFRIKPFRDRSRGWQLAMRRYKLPIEKKYILTLPTTMEEAYKKMKDYLETRPPLPTAFIADNDILALGALKAFTEMGYRVPEDVSLIGYDDLPYSAVSQPALTTTRVPKGEMGKIAVRRVYDIMTHDEPHLYLEMELCTTFIERESVMDLRGL